MTAAQQSRVSVTTALPNKYPSIIDTVLTETQWLSTNSGMVLSTDDMKLGDISPTCIFFSGEQKERKESDVPYTAHVPFIVKGPYRSMSIGRKEDGIFSPFRSVGNFVELKAGPLVLASVVQGRRKKWRRGRDSGSWFPI
ncbi:hypothetical protein FGSG_12812 [Fusarium graminearum PH-1]|uniref:Chromosome 3, complete genome n=1 Tax=Gibberella zeae (strain ATCC MYA-4620 / CBS 123657 / FGSC 9075 / NRRL 31084 / PH-1) TaxID=229533 RepID=I1S7I9_GIBZE|nr:hypothetical protein FGSG_12812 [Fusarium graminearum PH-1]ESU11798.1 hypothetical protein FGSG_12812 [Fusarium graminearum PH-1]CEF86934.1 unnamed protein product [Fusarium graminearum]|eukprot:XP_011324374.1 hypothetical protein FGSG_12812 [Fusarium graminearum PH-1]